MKLKLLSYGIANNYMEDIYKKKRQFLVWEIVHKKQTDRIIKTICYASIAVVIIGLIMR